MFTRYWPLTKLKRARCCSSDDVSVCKDGNEQIKLWAMKLARSSAVRDQSRCTYAEERRHVPRRAPRRGGAGAMLAATHCSSVLGPRWVRVVAAFSACVLLLLLAAGLKTSRQAPVPRAFVPLASDLSSPLCDWRTAGPFAGARPADEAALAAAVLHAAEAKWDSVGGSAGAAPACDPAGCFVAVRSAPVFMSVGAVSIVAASADQVRHDAHACRPAPDVAPPGVGSAARVRPEPRSRGRRARPWRRAAVSGGC